jgi:predicted membrane channel-forming protein YqfA (hemolysin III family)
MDLIMAKVGFGIYFTLLILNTKVRMKEILLLNMMILFYFLSNNRITNKKEDWVYFHMIFHIFVTIDQMMTIKGLLDN